MSLKTVLINIILSFVLIEFFLYIKFSPNSEGRYVDRDLSQFVLTNETLERVSVLYNYELGWKQSFPGLKNQFGERPVLYYTGPDITEAVLFGSSFVYGAYVEHNETWAYFMGAALNKKVLNFGQPAYGLDQALIYFQQKKEVTPARYAIWGITPPDIFRSGSNYRYFLKKIETGFELTKPGWSLQQGQLTFVPNPIESAEQLKKLQDVEFISALAKNDYIFTRYAPPVFPRILNLFSADGVQNLKGISYGNALTDAFFRSLTIKLLKEFKDSSLKAEKSPLFLLMPTRNMFEVKNSKTRLTESAEKFNSQFQEICKEIGIKCYFPYAIFTNEPHLENDFQSENGGHYTPAGNKKLGLHMAQWIKQQP